jgi:uncharacterized repeat protein (TIGR03943 family)
VTARLEHHVRDRAARQAQAVVMLLLGGAVLRITLTGTYLRYVKEGLRPLLLAAGILLVAAAVMTLWHDLRPRTRRATGHDGPDDEHAAHDDGEHDGHDDGHGHAHREPRVGWLLLVPALALLLLAPPALGSSAAGRSGSVLATQGSAFEASDYAALPPGDPVQLGLLDYAARAVYDQGRTLAGRQVQLTGFLTPGPDGGTLLTRMILNCCAADGRPIKVALTGDVPAGLAPDTWVRVVGGYVPQTAKDPVNDAAVPYLRVTGWQETPAPAQPYEIAQPPQ